MSALSSNTESLIHTLYKSREAKEIADILENECGTEALGCTGWTPVQMERIRFAVLKLSLESETGLDRALKLATSDCRDLLMVAGFGEDLKAHEKWYESVAN
ncbi:hypothetical protein [Colwellia echini]|uniref:DUF3775 domain-containing protein n=1 Tax=Colwellia echini TaxID=1982103 RepID=A0ABY3MSJ8_9GAMM|nr:hypothetical protein [Colwellia echini]TYK64172.1 hypothetical protein CWS31_017065 [Colwellia echini]